MSLFHRHKWAEKERFYAPPGQGKFEIERALPELLERLAFGITIILYKCECGEIKTVEILGQSKPE